MCASINDLCKEIPCNYFTAYTAEMWDLIDTSHHGGVVNLFAAEPFRICANITDSPHDDLYLSSPTYLLCRQTVL